MAAKLIYYGTGEEMRLGDRIAVRSLGSDVVCTVTDIRLGSRTGAEPAVGECAFQTDDGILHAVERVLNKSAVQIGRNIRLVCRSGCELETASEILGHPPEKHPPVSWWDIFTFADFGCGVFTAVGLVAAFVAWL